MNQEILNSDQPNVNVNSTSTLTSTSTQDSIILLLLFAASLFVFVYCTLPGAMFVIGYSKKNPGSFCLLLGSLWILGLVEFIFKSLKN